MRIRVNGLVLASLLLISNILLAQEPSLPTGLGASNSPAGASEPDLPAGMDSGEPDLPAFNSDNEASVWDSVDDKSAGLLSGVSGFWELRGGLRTRNPVEQRHSSLAESRLELKKEFYFGSWTSKLAADFLYDDIADSQRIDLEQGQGWTDLREAWLHRRIGTAADVKAGRQVLTWGVGDLLFINDLFPKDWQSFLAGRDEQYLKAPSDALRVGMYSEALNINVVYTPKFDADRFISGERLSFYSPTQGGVVGRDHPVETDQPDHIFEDDEIALRLYRSVASFEIALYGYSGYWKSPGGFDPLSGLATFPRLRVYGASGRGPVGPGILSTEIGFYDSRDDSDGADPFINNSEWRALLGYEWELMADTTLALQFYVEALQDYDAYKASLFPGQRARDEYRQLLTARLTRLALNQNLTLSLFAFYSYTDNDSYLRPKASYKLTDNWLLEGGFNLFQGKDEHTFFGQFESNSNGYVAIRYSF